MAKNRSVGFVGNADLKAKIVARLYELYDKAAEDCAKNGCVQKSKRTGFEVVRPQYTVMNDTLDKLIAFVPEFKDMVKPHGNKKAVKKEKEQDFDTE